jgi:hypothetical protein
MTVVIHAPFYSRMLLTGMIRMDGTGSHVEAFRNFRVVFAIF